MDGYDQPGVPFSQLSPQHQAEADRRWGGDRHPLDRYTYSVTDGQLDGWRYYIPSEACQRMIASLITSE